MFNRRGFLKALLAAPAAALLGVQVSSNRLTKTPVVHALGFSSGNVEFGSSPTWTTTATTGSATITAHYISERWAFYNNNVGNVSLVRVWDNDEDSVYDA